MTAKSVRNCFYYCVFLGGFGSANPKSVSQVLVVFGKKCIKGVRQDWPPPKKTNQILLEAHALGTRPSSETLGSTQTAEVDTWKAAKAEELLSQMMVLTVRPNEFSSLAI